MIVLLPTLTPSPAAEPPRPPLAPAPLPSAPSAARLTPPVSPYHVENWDIDNGLPQNTVTAICQSHDGYLWLGTQNGLARFDGVHFKTFSPETAPGFPGNRISCLFEDSNHRLWFGVEGHGIAILASGIVSRPPGLELPDNTVTCITADPTNGLWLGTIRGEVIHYAHGKIQVFDREEGLPGPSLAGLVCDKAGTLWAATDDWVGTLANGRFTPHPWPVSGTPAITRRSQGGIWLADRSGLAHLSPTHGQRLHPFAKPENVHRIIEDRHGAVWLGLRRNGLLKATATTIESIPIADLPAPATVLALLEDAEGILWTGLRNGGISRVKPRLVTPFDKHNGLPDENILSVCEAAAGGVWLGTENGLCHFQPGTPPLSLGTAHGLSNAPVTAVWEDRQRTLWAGTWGSGLFRRQNDRFVRIETLPEPATQLIRAIHEDNQGKIWIGTDLTGAFRLDTLGHLEYSTSGELAHSSVRAIWRDRTGTVWFGTGGGLGRLRDGKLANLTTESGLPSNFIRTLFEAENGALWVGTAAGLVRIQNDQIVALRSRHGLPDTYISQILADHGPALWFGSNRGIFRVRRFELEAADNQLIPEIRAVTFNKSDGLGGHECNGGYQPGACRTRDGLLWFPTPRGVAVVDPAKHRVNPRPPRVLIEEVIADNHQLPLLNPTSNSRPNRPTNPAFRADTGPWIAHVPTSCRRLQIRFTAINFAAPRRLQLEYRLNNHDRDWRDAGPDREAFYLNPVPGVSEFRLRALSNDGFWSDDLAVLTLVVGTPFWRTWWFLALTSTSTLAAFAYTIRLASQRKLRRSLAALAQQHALDAERSRIAADMHDQLGSRLTHLTMLSELSRRELSHPETLARNLDKLTTQSRQVARSLDEIVWTVNPGNDTIERTAAYMVHFTEEFFEPFPIRCLLEVPARLPDRTLTSDRRHELFLAFKEALNNVAKHAQATEVTLRLATTPDCLTIVIHDNGCGFTPGTNAGHGLGNMSRRITTIGGHFELTSVPGQGTTVTFQIPLSPATAPATPSTHQPAAVGNHNPPAPKKS